MIAPARFCCKLQTMNPCHAVALALAGWYLLVPPVTSIRPDGSWDSNTPLSTRYVDSHYDSESGCQSTHLREKTIAETLCLSFVSQQVPRARATGQRLVQMTEAECISTDDLRLKGIEINDPSLNGK